MSDYENLSLSSSHQMAFYVNCSKSPLKVILEESSRQDLCLIPKSGRRGMIAKSAWNSMRIKNDQDAEVVKISKGVI